MAVWARCTRRRIRSRVHDAVRHRTDTSEILVLSMEYLEGETLRQRLERTPKLDRHEILSIARQIVEAFGAIHAANIIHRDLKANNVMLVPDGREATGLRAVVMDFGLARLDAATGFESVITSTGRVMATPAYVAPEQLEAGLVGPWTDVYAFGVVLFEMVCGRLPFKGLGRGGRCPSAAYPFFAARFVALRPPSL